MAACRQLVLPPTAQELHGRAGWSLHPEVEELPARQACAEMCTWLARMCVAQNWVWATAAVEGASVRWALAVGTRRAAAAWTEVLRMETRSAVRQTPPNWASNHILLHR